jgi:hypothetical protein
MQHQSGAVVTRWLVEGRRQVVIHNQDGGGRLAWRQRSLFLITADLGYEDAGRILCPVTTAVQR